MIKNLNLSCGLIFIFILTFSNFAIAQQKEEYFEKGLLRLKATDNDGWAYVKTWISKWNDEKRRWDSVISKRGTRCKKPHNVEMK